MGSAVLVVCRLVDNHEFCFHAAKRQIWNVSNCICVYLLIVRNGIFTFRNVQIIAVPSSKSVDLLMFTNSGFRVRNVEIWAVMFSNEVIC